MSATRRLPSHWFFLCLVAGCGGGGAADESVGAGCADCGPYADVLDAFCGVMDRCPGAVYPVAYRSRGECVAILAWATTCRLEDDEVNDVHHYRLQRTIPAVSAAGPACIAWLKSASCQEIALKTGSSEQAQSAGSSDAGAEASPCEGVFRLPDDDDDDDNGSTRPRGAALGEACRHGDQTSCRFGLFCAAPVFMPATSTESCAVCAALPGAGQPCGGAYHCAMGLYCKPDTWTIPDRGGTCRAPAPDGGECLDGGQCQSGFCRRPSGALGTCDPAGKVGSPCAARHDCRSPLLCGAQGQCEAQRAQGAPCTTNEQCAGGQCDPGSMTCGAPDGTTCRSSQDCRSGYCNETTRVCGTRKAAGEACTTYSECLSNECRNRVCFERCGSDRPCPAGQFCASRTQQCQTLGAEGGACEDDDECLSGWCSPADRCGKKPQIGDRCARADECYPEGYCAGQVCVKRHAPGAVCAALDSCQEPFLCRHGRCQLINLSCAPARAGTMCAYLRVCEDGAYCDVQDAFTCKARKASGESCAQTAECNADLFCQSDPQTGSRRCVARVGAGMPCQGDECAATLHCIGDRTTRTCLAGPAGQPCSSQAPCPAGYHCNDDRVCHPPLPLGGNCLRQSGVPCEQGLYCDSSNGCRPKKQAGEPCAAYTPCLESLRCVGVPTICQPRAKAGESCSSSSSGSDSGCDTGLFCEYDQTLKQTVCIARRELGEPCNANDRCKSGACGQSGRCLTANVCKTPAP